MISRLKSFFIRGVALGAGMLVLSALVAAYIGHARFGLPLTDILKLRLGDAGFLAKLVPMEFAGAFALIAFYDLGTRLEAAIRTWWRKT